jgi:hypothetical protein
VWHTTGPTDSVHACACTHGLGVVHASNKEPADLRVLPSPPSTPLPSTRAPPLLFLSQHDTPVLIPCFHHIAPTLPPPGPIFAPHPTPSLCGDRSSLKPTHSGPLPPSPRIAPPPHTRSPPPPKSPPHFVVTTSSLNTTHSGALPRMQLEGCSAIS